jgi:hypothetical protein
MDTRIGLWRYKDVKKHYHFGFISFYVFRFMNTRWPASAETSLLWLAIGIAVLFTVMAAVIFKMRGFVELTFLHILYVAIFGWLMPKLIVI